VRPTKRQWQPIPLEGECERLAETAGISSLTARLLVNRGIGSAPEAVRFLSPDLTHLHDPFLLPGMAEAVSRIKRAIAGGEKICVYGDFDVDGITSSVLLYSALIANGAAAEVYVPDRMREGYGLNAKAVGAIARRCSLLVTVDCGITAIDEVEFARSKGLDVIITDHHEPGERLPAALAVIDPKIAGCGYPFTELAGVGVAFKLVQALLSELGGDPLDYLDLVTLGTVADVVPLLDENRVLVAAGLSRLAESERAGLRALLSVTALDQKPALSSGQVGFVLAPRINAAGRLASAREAVELLLTSERQKADAIARAVDERNRERQRLEEGILSEAMELVETTVGDEEKSIVLTSPGWHEGVKGIVASRIVDRFCRPTFLFSVKDGAARGSARSIPGLNLYEVLCDCAPLLTRFGGHAAAAGLTLPVQKVPELKERLETLLKELLRPEDLVPKLRIDAVVSAGQITQALAAELGSLAPFGMGNPSPVLAAEDIYLEGQQRVGASGDHLKFMVRGPGRALEAIAFRLPEIETVESHFGRADVAFHLERDEWQGVERLQLRVVDLRLDKAASAERHAEDEDPLVEHLFANADEIISEHEYKHIADADCFYTKVAGVTFEGRQDVLLDLQAGEPVVLERERDNPHDANAIRVLDGQGRQLGYLAAGLAACLAPGIDGGSAYEAEISEVTGGDEKHLGVNLLVSKAGHSPQDDRREAAAARNEWRELPEEQLAEGLAAHFLGTGSSRSSSSGPSGGVLSGKQREALAALERGENSLVVMGTGRGKSLIFHVHAARLALARGALSIFVYPLRALISDQQQHLDEVFAAVGLRALTLNGDVTLAARDEAFSAIEAGEVDVVLTTPEFLHHHLARFEPVASRTGFVVVDECHHVCTASSGHRPLYKRLDEVVERLGDPLVLAVSATVADEAAEEISRAFGIRTRVIDRGVRENLVLADRRGKKGKEEYVKGLVARGEKTIVYVNSREQSVRLAEYLRRELGDRSGRVIYYNAGLNKEMRKAIESRFRAGASTAIVATSAFGEGINIADVRNVVLYHMPLSRIEYNQQSGRCGRDGEPATIHLLFGQDELRLNRRLLESYSPSRPALVELYKLLRDLAGEECGSKNASQEGDGPARGGAGFQATNEGLLEMLAQRRTKASLSARGVSSALRIFEELGLLRIEGSGRHRRILVAPAPRRRLSLSDSVRFKEGDDEKAAFEEFAAWALEGSKRELLAAINRPICPSQSGGTDEARKPEAAGPEAEAPEVLQRLEETFGSVLEVESAGPSGCGEA